MESRILTSASFPSETSMKVGIGPRRSSKVCILMAPFRDRNRAQGNTDKQRSMVVESKAYTVLSRSKPSDSLEYMGRAVWMSTWAKSDRKPCPGEHGQTEIDGCRVQGIHRVVEIETKRLAGIHGASGMDEHLGEVGEDAPVAGFVGVGRS